MAEHITGKQIEQLFKLADEIIRAPSRFTKDFVVENLGLGVADLCGVIDRLRAQLAEIGETEVEWGFRETYPNGTVFTEAECDRDCAERAISRTELPAKLIRRLAGEWPASGARSSRSPTVADAKLHLEIGPQYVEAAREAVEKAVAPFRNLGEYWIRSDGDDSGERWLSIGHAPCKREIYDSWKNDGPELNIAQVMQLIAEHHCAVSE